MDAFDRLEVLESTAEAMIKSRPLGRMTPMSARMIQQLKVLYSHGKQEEK